ncbi:MAG: thermonuclease family protein [Xanthobacteraceae bacterium]|nr:thermonuclease family protein [Xanthobacteraceae bacterium]
MARSAALLIALYGALGYYLYETSSGAVATHVEGIVTVVDGDTLVITGKRLRLVDIDAPELDQTCGEDRSKIWLCGESSAEAMRKHLAGQVISCNVRGYDRHHRLLGLCSLPDGSDINSWAVREGWALTYNLDNAYEKEQRDASIASRGISSSKFIRPSEWRAQGYHDAASYTGD